MVKKMNKEFKTWASEAIPRWWVFVLLLMVAVIVQYDNDPNVLEVRTRADVRLTHERLSEANSVDSLAARYAEAWGDWFAMDEQLARQIILAADKQSVPHHVAFGLVAVESGFHSNAVSEAGAIGLTQVRLPTARIYEPDISEFGLLDVEKNLNIGFAYFHDLLHRYDGDVYLALAAYNMGPTKLDRKMKSGRKISMRYPNKVMGR